MKTLVWLYNARGISHVHYRWFSFFKYLLLSLVSPVSLNTMCRVTIYSDFVLRSVVNPERALLD